MIAAIAGFLASSCIKGDEEDRELAAAEEIKLREEYLDELIADGIQLDTTDLGVYYYFREEGEGDLARPGDTLTVTYSGYFINGRLFDSSQNYGDGKYRFILEDQPMIAGWDDGMKVMNEGALAEFIIPSSLAYGDDWYSGIPPYQTLVFVVELNNLRPLSSN